MACAEFPTAGLTPNVSTHTVDGVTYLWTGEVWEILASIPKAKSPDGTLYELTPPNGGGAATWTAV